MLYRRFVSKSMLNYVTLCSNFKWLQTSMWFLSTRQPCVTHTWLCPKCTLVLFAETASIRGLRSSKTNYFLKFTFIVVLLVYGAAISAACYRSYFCSSGFKFPNLISSCYLVARRWIISSVGVTNMSLMFPITLLLMSFGRSNCFLIRLASNISISFLEIILAA